MDMEFFEELEKKAGGSDHFLKEASKLRSFLDWNAPIFGDAGRHDIMKDPKLLLFLSNGYDKVAIHFDATSRAFKSYDASAVDLTGWFASEKEIDIADFEEWIIDNWRIANEYIQALFIKEFEEDDGK